MSQAKPQWYMVSTISTKEEAVIDSLKQKVEVESMQNYFFDFKIFWEPKISATELKKKSEGKDYKIKKVNIYKGYIFIKMIMSDEAWFLVRNTEFVTGLIGSSGKGAKPIPISEREMGKMFANEIRIEKEFEKIEYTNPFPKGSHVRITFGSFVNERGIVIESDIKKRHAIVDIEVFGKKVPTEFSFKALKIQDQNEYE
ncbi:MAG: transcription termination/antitermination protein NusG [Metamycoplasmataceae bacterium]